MLAALLLVLGAEASPCDATPPAPKIPLPSEFSCPFGATASASGTGPAGDRAPVAAGGAGSRGGGADGDRSSARQLECISRDGKPTGDTFAIDGKTGLMVHPLGLTVAWTDGVVSWWQQRPTGHRIAYEGGKPARVEHYVGGELQCAKHFEGARLLKRFDDGKWTWLDKQGKAVAPAMPLEKSEIASALREHAAEVQLCYESRLHEVKGEFRGNIAFAVEIGGGDVKSVKATEDTLHDPPVTDCIAARIKDWKFRVANEDVEVTFPFVFKERR